MPIRQAPSRREHVHHHREEHDQDRHQDFRIDGVAQPHHEQRPALPLPMPRDAVDRAHRQAVVAAHEQRHRAGRGQLIGTRRDRTDPASHLGVVVGVRRNRIVAEIEIGPRHVAVILDGVVQLFEHAAERGTDMQALDRRDRRQEARNEFTRFCDRHGIGIVVIRATGGADGLRGIAHIVRMVMNRARIVAEMAACCACCGWYRVESTLSFRFSTAALCMAPEKESRCPHFCSIV